MSTTTPPADPVGDVRRLHRSREDRILGGVCSGLARYFNIDPTIVRIAAAALLLLGGVGIIAYLAAWLLVPEEDSDEPLLRTGIGLEHGRARVIAGGILLVVAILMVAGRLVPDVSDDLIAPLILGLAGILLLVGPQLGDERKQAARDAKAREPADTEPAAAPPEFVPAGGDDDATRADDAAPTPGADRPEPGTALEPASPTAVTRAVPIAPAGVPTGFVTPAYGGGEARPPD